MPDREKLIKHFEHLIDAAKGNYQDFVDLTVDAGEEILTLLKEQEATIEILVKDITFHNCNNCNRKDCESKPNAGQPVRSNCIYWLESR